MYATNSFLNVHWQLKCKTNGTELPATDASNRSLCCTNNARLKDARLLRTTVQNRGSLLHYKMLVLFINMENKVIKFIFSVQVYVSKKFYRNCCSKFWRLFESNSNLHTVHTARGPTPHNHSQHNQCRTPYVVIHSLVLLKMGIMMPETCWDRSLVIKTRLVASCWFLSLHPTFMMHGHKSPKKVVWSLYSPLFFVWGLHLDFRSVLLP